MRTKLRHQYHVRSASFRCRHQAARSGHDHCVVLLSGPALLTAPWSWAQRHSSRPPLPAVLVPRSSCVSLCFCLLSVPPTSAGALRSPVDAESPLASLRCSARSPSPLLALFLQADQQLPVANSAPWSCLVPVAVGYFSRLSLLGVQRDLATLSCGLDGGPHRTIARAVSPHRMGAPVL